VVPTEEEDKLELELEATTPLGATDELDAPLAATEDELLDAALEEELEAVVLELLDTPSRSLDGGV